jgi:hypothetical protein
MLLSASPAAAQGASAKLPPDQAADTWIFSETQSPLDYAPVTIASAWSYTGGEGRGMQLSIQCRHGRTDLVIVGTDTAGGLDPARVSYVIDGGPPTAVAAGPATSGTGVAIKGDVVRLLTTLPRRGELIFRIATEGAPLEGHYALAALDGVLDRLAGPCKWPPRQR